MIRPAGRPAVADPRQVLSPREVEVVEMAALGLTNGQIASRLCLTVHTVKFHLGAVYRKLDVRNRTDAAVVYLQFRASEAANDVDSVA